MNLPASNRNQYSRMLSFLRARPQSFLALSVSTLLLGSLFMAPAALAAPSQKPALPDWTPYQKNAFLFHSMEQAIGALNNPDILMRRSAVESLGRTTCTDGASVSLNVHSSIDRFRRHTEAIPAMIQAVREMPDRDSQQAAVLLALYPPKATASAIPAVCEAMTRSVYEQDFAGRLSLLDALIHICGGRNNTAPMLAALINAPDTNTRRAVAAAFRICPEMTSGQLPQWDYASRGMSPGEAKVWRESFYRIALPALGTALADRDRSVRLAATHALDSLAFRFQKAPWHLVLIPLARAAESADPELSLAATKTLADLPFTDLSRVARSLRVALRKEPQATPRGKIASPSVRNYALLALSRAARDNPSATLDAFLSDLTDRRDTNRRRLAAADLQIAAATLWSAPGPAASRFALPGYLSAPRSGKGRLLTALTTATQDSDSTVARSSALALLQIGKRESMAPGVASRRPGEDAGRADVIAALRSASKSLATIDRGLSQNLESLAAYLSKPFAVA